MNNTRRKAITKMIESLSNIKDEIENLSDEEQEFVDNAPENLMYSERYERAGEIAQELGTIADEIYD